MKTALFLFVTAAATMFFLNFDQTKRERLVLSTDTPSGYTKPKGIERETIESRLAQVDAVAEAETTPEQIMAKVAASEKPAVVKSSAKVGKAKKLRAAKHRAHGKKSSKRTQIARR